MIVSVETRVPWCSLAIQLHRPLINLALYQFLAWIKKIYRVHRRQPEMQLFYFRYASKWKTVTSFSMPISFALNKSFLEVG